MRTGTRRRGLATAYGGAPWSLRQADRAEHDALAATYEAHGLAVQWVERVHRDKLNARSWRALVLRPMGGVRLKPRNHGAG